MAAYFSIILVLVTLVSGLIWALDAFVLAPKRQAKLALAQAQNGTLTDEVTEKIIQEPGYVETSKSIFPVIAFVLILRSFSDPFRLHDANLAGG
ncbi:MAG: hypothetical protein Sw2LagPseu_00600 [Shewanella algae]